MNRIITALLFFVVGSVLLPQSVHAADAANGRIIWLSAGCTSCHSDPPDSRRQEIGSTVAGLRGAFARIPQMAGFQGAFTQAQLEDLAAYLANPSSGNPPPVPTENYTDIWYNPSESGWGINITQHASNQIFAVIYLYEPGGVPAWFTIPGGAWQTPTRFTGKLYRTFAPLPTVGTFDATKVRNNEVGTATLEFTSSNTATLSYTADGQTVVKSIRKLEF